MQKIVVNKKSGFFSSEPVIITDKNGNAFYIHTNEAMEINFNLPEGVFYSKNKIFKLHKPVEYEKNFPFHLVQKIEKVEVKNNPNKATIYTGKKKIEIDKSLMKTPHECILLYVIGHELGHFYFKNESKCDKFAFDFLIDLGYNPTQIKYAHDYLLKNNISRCKHFDDSLTTKKLRK